jgi:hypothetical protein
MTDPTLALAVGLAAAPWRGLDALAPAHWDYMEAARDRSSPWHPCTRHLAISPRS